MVFFANYFAIRIFLRATPHFIAIVKGYKMTGSTQKNTDGKAVFVQIEGCEGGGGDGVAAAGF